MRRILIMTGLREHPESINIEKLQLLSTVYTSYYYYNETFVMVMLAIHDTVSRSVPGVVQGIAPHKVPVLAGGGVGRHALGCRPGFPGRVTKKGNALPQQLQRLPVYPESHPVRHEAVPAVPNPGLFPADYRG